MTFLIDPAWAVGVFLLSLRLGTLFVMSPLWGVTGGPPTVRILIIAAFAATMVSALPPGSVAIPQSLGALVAAAACEVAVGGMLAFGVFAAFAAFMFGGKILDVQVGFGLGNVFDPVTHGQSPVIGSLLNLLAVALFFAVDGHLAFMRGVAYSLEAVPLGRLPASFPIEAVVKQFGAMFVAGLALVAPVSFGLLTAEAGLAALSRNLPQMNVFVVAIPVKIIVGLAMLAASIGYVGPLASRIFASMFRYWEGALLHG